MMSPKAVVVSASALLAAAAVAGCSGWSYSPAMRGNPYIEGMNRGSLNEAAPKAPGTFTQSLASEYAGLANEVSKTPTTGASGDWDDADYFARKGLRVQRGEAVPPENNANWLIPLEGS